MQNKIAIMLYTLIRKEWIRMFRISTQVFLPSVITSCLYFLIFGTLIGPRIGEMNHIPYILFIAPGLIMMSVITNSYGNTSSSLFNARFQKNIEEMLVSPMPIWVLLAGFLAGGLIRGLIVGLLVYGVALCFTPLTIHDIPLTIVVILLVSGVFSLAGIINALLARTFEDIMFIPTFILTPLTYLGGVFYSSHLLSPFWLKVSYLNPIWYMVNAFRQVMLANSEITLSHALIFIISLFLILLILNFWLLKKGVGLRS